ncbi:type VI secretion system membrane subunit TssM [Paraburkholderia sp. Tr-20389]|uniref:type VI secretion system membrane subunit TssM n=1 Tax=Paraburkholderia sp. Tr-20389 TaxID=2703903 RepID=UPI00197E5ED2|nr:type VI secretion system membrane subunit TssM [Paraburkholderia sp. Tr-20389]MBN3752366.1 type VI secretion system membrane subunit TssM [Paraburkholderia sp. Tr-20389]
MKRLSFLISRWFLALLVVVVLGLLIWFLGPFVAFGGLRPLSGMAMRVIVIVLLLAGMLLWLRGLPVSIVFGILLCLLIWYAAPLLSIGHIEPFASVAARVAAVALVAACFAVWGLWWLWRKMREDEAFLKKALAFGTPKEASPAADRLKDVEARFDDALTRLKAMRTGARGMSRLLQGGRYLYEIPWYIALGSSTSGKTSALLNAGLPFPVDTGTQRAVGSRVRTKNVDFLLSNEAVLIDTAGHYTRHDEGPLDTGYDVTAGDESERINAAEWSGFLALLRRHRPRTPINGAVLSIKIDVLTATDPAVRATEASALRTRLADLRAVLGIRFPVYLLITQTDRLTGFADYFRSLTDEDHAQIWGFTLPFAEGPAPAGLSLRCGEELRQLAASLASNVNTRLEDEYDSNRRRRLAALPDAFSALVAPLTDLVSQIFLDSRYDDTQSHASPRGVYFTSATQGGATVIAEPLTIVQRLATGLGTKLAAYPLQPEASSAYFLRDLFTKVVFPEAHLVTPNLRWQYRFRALRLLGHMLAAVLFVWLIAGMYVSFGNNSAYLDSIHRKTQTLAAQVGHYYRDPKPDALPGMLSDARYLPALSGLDLSDPDGSYRYGLYAAPGVVDAAHRTYLALDDNLLLPRIVHRMEDVISQSIANKDAQRTYEALRVYLMLYDKAKFKAEDVKAWVIDDWSKTDSASMFGYQASMVEHVGQLFSGERVVQSPLPRNDALIQDARTFLDSTNTIQRLYDRAKSAMQNEAPDDFTVLRVIGPQAGAVFTRASGTPLSRGVPGLFTYDGYHNVFDKRLRDFARSARNEDAWVMGRFYNSEAEKKTAEFADSLMDVDDPVAAAIRRLYLTEYVQQWDALLVDIRAVTGSSLSFNLLVLRQLAAPDSPLTHLARAAVRETTLTRPPGGDGSLLAQTAGKLSQKAQSTFGSRTEEHVEKEIVDRHFSALRQIVTGNADVASEHPNDAAVNVKSSLDGIVSMLGDYYTTLTIYDNAINNNSLPPASDIATKLKVLADTLPDPFQQVLLGLSVEGSREVHRGVGQFLSHQMQTGVGETCRLAVEGNFPFSPGSTREVSIDDFTRVFAKGGLIDSFFTQTLAPFVDTASRPWRYRALAGAADPVQGPDLEPFEHAKAIRDVFFDDQGKQLAWKAGIRVPELDPTITSLSVDIDGQTMQYQHGPVTTFNVGWPGPRGGVHAEITANPRIRLDTSTIAADGPWALLHLIRKGEVVQTASAGRTRVVFSFDGRKAVLDIASAASVANPLTSNLLTTFRCPGSLSVPGLPDSGPPAGLPPA